MKITIHKSAAKAEDFLTTVARSIGSTLGTAARKIKPSARNQIGAERNTSVLVSQVMRPRAADEASPKARSDAAIRQRSSPECEESPQGRLYCGVHQDADSQAKS
jgi:hypothetical protein